MLRICFGFRYSDFGFIIMTIYEIDWPRAILHLDANAFFASVFQAVNPKLKGKPVVVGAERGIATAISYEARKFGVTRGMRMFEIKNLCPQCIIMEGDYELFALFSSRMFSILRQYTPVVDEYSVDECFGDLLELYKFKDENYQQIGARIQNQVQNELGIPVSIGISVTKTLAKLASESKKPSGLTVVSMVDRDVFLKTIPVEDVWGIGPATTTLLKRHGIKTAHSLASIRSPSSLPKGRLLNKNHLEIIQELNGNLVYPLNPNAKTDYKSMSSVRTFHPPTNDRQELWSRLRENIEDVFAKARNYNYKVKRISIFLKTQTMQYFNIDVNFTEPLEYPLSKIEDIKNAFLSIYNSEYDYRATGATISNLVEPYNTQVSLFESESKQRNSKVEKVYNALKGNKISFGTSLWNKKGKQEKSLPTFSLPILNVK